ncbi:hypothetical protein GCM10008983_05790 [Lentibacillus halophilus]|uniref:Uncharacterized protein n=1 Tax=Lentibacillus halophilus TaxID=295065 RepID=A0ABP3IXW8_9BACI
MEIQKCTMLSLFIDNMLKVQGVFLQLEGLSAKDLAPHPVLQASTVYISIMSYSSLNFSLNHYIQLIYTLHLGDMVDV